VGGAVEHGVVTDHTASILSSLEDTTANRKKPVSGMPVVVSATKRRGRRVSWRQYSLLAIAAAAFLVAAIGSPLLMLKLSTPTGSIVVTTDQPEIEGAHVSLDGQTKFRIGRSGPQKAIRLAADDQHHTLFVTRDGFQPYSRQIRISDSTSQRVFVHLSPVAKSSVTPAPSQASRQFPAGSSADILTSDDWEWMPPENLGPIVNSADTETTPFLTNDGLSLFLCSNRLGGRGKGDLFVSTRPSTESAWSRPVNLGAPINSPRRESWPRLSADGLTIFFSVEDDLPIMHTYTATRVSLTDRWSAADVVGSPINSRTSNAISAWPSPDGHQLFFASARSGGLGGWDIWLSTRSSPAEAWSSPQNLGPNVNTSQDELSPCLASDQLTLLFQVHPEPTKPADLMISTRQSTAAPWSPAVSLGPIINSNMNDADPCLSPDNRTLFFASNRLGGQDDFDIWMSHRVPKKGVSTNRSTNEQTNSSNRDIGATQGGFALEFNGKDSYVDLPTLRYDGSHPITIEATVVSHGADAAATIIGDAKGTGLALQFPDENKGVANVIASENEQDFTIAASKDAVMPHRQVHVAAQIDGQELRLYLDGKLQQRRELTKAYKPGRNFMRIGVLPPISAEQIRRPFPGVTDEVRISKVARYKSDFTPPTRFETDKDTLAIYHFDEGQGEVLTDSSGNGHHGKIVNAKWVPDIASGPAEKSSRP
jgi:Tol biopolymer transport system component